MEAAGATALSRTSDPGVLMSGAQPRSASPGTLLLLGTGRMLGGGLALESLSCGGNTTKEAADGAIAQGWAHSSRGTG